MVGECMIRSEKASLYLGFFILSENHVDFCCYNFISFDDGNDISGKYVPIITPEEIDSAGVKIGDMVYCYFNVLKEKDGKIHILVKIEAVEDVSIYQKLLVGPSGK